MMVNGMMFEPSSMKSILMFPSMDRENLYDLILLIMVILDIGVILEGTWN